MYINFLLVSDPERKAPNLLIDIVEKNYSGEELINIYAAFILLECARLKSAMPWFILQECKALLCRRNISSP